jgi:hypothetical protein
MNYVLVGYGMKSMPTISVITSLSLNFGFAPGLPFRQSVHRYHFCCDYNFNRW